VSIYGQYIGFETHIISDTTEGPYFVIDADIDNDGDMDLFAASSEDGELNWFENDGQGNFVKHFIGFALNACHVSSGDMDGDGDMDVVAASWGDDKIAWWENTDGQGTFVEHIMTTSADVARSVFCSDIDGDGDEDVVVSYLGDDTVAWWENTDGQGTFVERIIASNQVEPRIVEAADFDGDGDKDVVTILMDEGKVIWYENLDGLGNFGPQQIILDDPGTAWSLTTGDINGDGYVDVIANTDSYTAWFENDGLGNFTIHDDVFSEYFSEGLYVEDIDADGDMDVVSAEIVPNEVGWFENIDGDGLNFRWRLIQDNAQTVRAVRATDINNDGLMDIISGWWGADVVAWHENMGLGIE
jgi:hypothetical protein